MHAQQSACGASFIRWAALLLHDLCVGACMRRSFGDRLTLKLCSAGMYVCCVWYVQNGAEDRVSPNGAEDVSASSYAWTVFRSTCSPPDERAPTALGMEAALRTRVEWGQAQRRAGLAAPFAEVEDVPLAALALRRC